MKGTLFYTWTGSWEMGTCETCRLELLVPGGVNNSILICEGKYGIDGTYRLSGQGAGAGPTTSSMIKDAIRLLQK